MQALVDEKYRPNIIRHIGDVHGKFRRYETILNNSPYPTMQVGDLGVGFRSHVTGNWSSNPPYDLMVEKNALFIRGNHDNPEVCREHTQCIDDGHVNMTTMYVGGALSIDKALRYPDFSWWEDEELAPEALSGLVHLMAIARPEMMVTHECPESIAEMIVGGLANLATPGQKIKLDPRFASRTRVAFEEMFGVHKPKLWVFGHWHVPFDRVVDGTRFICLPELACLDIDVDKAEPVGELVMQK